MSSEAGYGGAHQRLRRGWSDAVETVLAGTAVVALWLIARAMGPEGDDPADPLPLDRERGS
jgi:hypothetical protein